MKQRSEAGAYDCERRLREEYQDDRPQENAIQLIPPQRADLRDAQHCSNYARAVFLELQGKLRRTTYSSLAQDDHDCRNYREDTVAKLQRRKSSIVSGEEMP